MRASAEKGETPEMTLEEINSEIKAARSQVYKIVQISLA